MYREVWLILGKQLCNLQHATSFANNQPQDALVELMMWQAMMFLPIAADPVLHNKLLGQPH